MANFHINPKTGNPGKCSAKQSCPFGDMKEDHYETKEEARKAFEEVTKEEALKAWKRKKVQKAPTPSRRMVNVSARTLELSKGTWEPGRHGGHGTFTPAAPTAPTPAPRGFFGHGGHGASF